MYQGEERRKTMNNEINDLKVEFAAFTSAVKEWMNTTTQYRKDLCAKQDKLLECQNKVNERINDLPCKERGEMYKSVDKTFFYIKLALGFAIALLIGHLGWK